MIKEYTIIISFFQNGDILNFFVWFQVPVDRKEKLHLTPSEKEKFKKLEDKLPKIVVCGIGKEKEVPKLVVCSDQGNEELVSIT